MQALQLQNLAAPVGRVTGALDERSIRLARPPREPGGVRAARRRRTQRAGHSARTGGATIQDGTEEARTLALFNGQEAIGIDIKKSKGYSTTDVARSRPRAARRELKTTLPKGTKIDIVKDAGERVATP